MYLAPVVVRAMCPGTYPSGNSPGIAVADCASKLTKASIPSGNNIILAVCDSVEKD